MQVSAGLASTLRGWVPDESGSGVEVCRRERALGSCLRGPEGLRSIASEGQTTQSRECVRPFWWWLNHTLSDVWLLESLLNPLHFS